MNENVIRNLVERQEKSLSEVARIFDKNVGQISRLCKKYNIVSRHMAKAAKKKLPLNKIRMEYEEEKKSFYKLSKKYNISAHNLKARLKKEFPNLKIRSIDEAKRPPELNDPQKLQELMNEMSAGEIGKKLGMKRQTVLDACKRHNISTDKWSALTIRPPKEDLESLYNDRSLSTIKIGDIYGVVHSTVVRWLKEYDIPIRGPGKNKDSKYEELNNEMWLRDKYQTQDMSMADIARLLGTIPGNIRYYLDKYDIPIRSQEDMLKKIECHGRKLITKTRFGEFECDSFLENEFLKSIEKNCDSIEKPDLIQSHGSSAYIDFVVDGDYVEVKSKSESEAPGISRTRLMKQYWIAKNNGIDIKVWNGKYYNLEPEDIDRYYCKNWKLIFESPKECSEWLINYGFKHVEFDRHKLIKGLRRYDKILEDYKGDDLLDSTIRASNTVGILKSFNRHFYYSSRTDHIAIPKVWEMGNHSVLKHAIDILWSEDKNINVYGLIDEISRNFKDFQIVSVFKPWVASYIYDKYVPSGGVVVDPCVGWGGRLLGCLYKNIKYVGSDLNKNSIDGAKDIANFIKSNIKDPKLEVLDATKNINQGDLLFTSPPYDNTELYHGIDSKNTKTEPIIRNIMSNFDGIIALNLPKNMESMCKNIATRYGRKLIEILEMETRSIIGRKKTYEPILVFDKK